MVCLCQTSCLQLKEQANDSISVLEGALHLKKDFYVHTLRTLDLLAADTAANGETESSTAGLCISADELHCQVGGPHRLYQKVWILNGTFICVVSLVLVSGSLWRGRYFLPPGLHRSDSLSKSPRSLQADQRSAKEGLFWKSVLQVALVLEYSLHIYFFFPVGLNCPCSSGWETTSWILECLPGFDWRLWLGFADHSLWSDQ